MLVSFRLCGDRCIGKTDEKGNACYFEMIFCFFYCMVAFIVFHDDVLEFLCIFLGDIFDLLVRCYECYSI